MRSPLNVFDGVVGAGNYWEKIQDSMEWLNQIIRKPGLWSCGADCQRSNGGGPIRASKQKTVWVSTQKV
jgi:hypothetical protein